MPATRTRLQKEPFSRAMIQSLLRSTRALPRGRRIGILAGDARASSRAHRIVAMASPVLPSFLKISAVFRRRNILAGVMAAKFSAQRLVGDQVADAGRRYDLNIEIELWAPAANWNGKFEAVGNGAFSGSIPYAAMAAALARGYATGATDTGHRGGSARFALGIPRKRSTSDGGPFTR